MSAEWYCRIRGQQVGPLSPAELKALAASGELVPDSLVRQGAAGQWAKAARVKGLFSATPRRGSPPAASVPSAATGTTSSQIEGLDDLTPLPTSPASLPPIGSLAVGQAVEFPDDLTVGQPILSYGVLPVGQSVPVGVPVGTPLPANAPARGAAIEVAGSGGRRSASSADDGYSKARVSGVAIVAIVFGFAGVCTLTIRNVQADLSIVPVVLGLAGTILALRAVTLASRKDTMSLGLSLVAMAVGFVAAGAGFYQIRPSDWEHLVNQVGAARTGAPLPYTGPQGSVPALAWHDASREQVKCGDVLVQISAAAIGPLSAAGPDGPASRPADVSGGEPVFLLLSVQVRNRSERKIEYHSWNSTVAESEPPTLADNLGGTYRRIVGQGGPLAGQLGKESLDPQQVLTDILMFEQPVPTFEYLELILPASAIGGSDPIRFRIPHGMVQQPAATEKPSDMHPLDGASKPAAKPDAQLPASPRPAP